VRALARRPGALPDGVEAVPGSLEDADALTRLCAGAHVLVHCAGAIRARDAAAFHATNALATGRLAAIAAQAGIGRFVHVSSLAARQPELSAYCASKRAGERLIERGAGPADWVIVRPPVIYGPGDRATLPIFRQAARGLLVEPRMTGPRMVGARLSLMHVADLVRLILALAEAPGQASGRVIEPDDGAGGHSWDAVAAAAASAAGRARLHRIRLPYRAAWLAGGLAGAVGVALRRPPLFSVGKAREAFHPDWAARDGAASLPGWRPEIRLDEGFRGTLAWYRERRWL
jgi:nucleoside-diphosphate-sugar epimerase